MKRILFPLFALSMISAWSQNPTMLSRKGTPSQIAKPALTLRQCIERAVERNIAVKQSDIARQQADIALNSARNAALPDLSVSASQGLNFGRALTINNTYAQRTTSSTSINVGASVPIYTGGRISLERQRATLNLAAATADVAVLRENLSLQIVQAYLQALYNADMVELSRANLVEAQKQSQRVAARIKAGKVPEVEMSEALSRIAQDQLSLTQSENTHALSLLALSQLLEMPTPDSLALVRPSDEQLPTITGNPEEIYLLALTERPALQAAELRIKAADKSIALARTGLRPTVSASAGLGTSYYHSSGVPNTGFGHQLKDNFGQHIGLSVSMPLFDRFNTRNSVRAAQLDRLNQQLVLDNQRKILYKDIQDAYYNALAAQQKHHSSIVAEEAATISLHAVEKKHEAGRATATEYDEARLKHLTAATQRLNARYELLLRAKILDFYRGVPLQ